MLEAALERVVEVTQAQGRQMEVLATATLENAAFQKAAGEREQRAQARQATTNARILWLTAVTAAAAIFALVVAVLTYLKSA